jgi:hypothetical protein
VPHGKKFSIVDILMTGMTEDTKKGVALHDPFSISLSADYSTTTAAFHF